MKPQMRVLKVASQPLCSPGTADVPAPEPSHLQCELRVQKWEFSGVFRRFRTNNRKTTNGIETPRGTIPQPAAPVRRPCGRTSRQRGRNSAYKQAWHGLLIKLVYTVQ